MPWSGREATAATCTFNESARMNNESGDEYISVYEMHQRSLCSNRGLGNPTLAYVCNRSDRNKEVHKMRGGKCRLAHDS